MERGLVFCTWEKDEILIRSHRLAATKFRLVSREFSFEKMEVFFLLFFFFSVWRNFFCCYF